MILILAYLCACKYVIITDLTNKSTGSLWQDDNTNQMINYCTKGNGEKSVGMSKSTGPIAWKRFFSINPSSRIYVYLEYSVSGQWNQNEFEIYANGVKILSRSITLNDVNRDCDSPQLYEQNDYFFYNKFADSLKLEVKVNAMNVGLFISNIVILQKALNYITSVNFKNFIPTCQAGFLFRQYLCECAPQVFEENICTSQCSQNFIYDSTMNECFIINHCSNCLGLNSALSCDPGYYQLDGSNLQSSSCVEQCPNDKFQDEKTKKCTDLQQYSQEILNQGNPVHYFFFFKNIPDFFHFFNYKLINFKIISIPDKINQRYYHYQDGTFKLGTFDNFQTQTISLSIQVNVVQYQVRFRAKGYFIDFYPSQNDIYINGIQMSESNIQISSKNILKADPDYVVNYDFYWIRPTPEIYQRNQNQIKLIISQPLQNGVYQGYFYLEDIQIYMFECQFGCPSCFTISYCGLCSNPQNKNLDDCTCMSGYQMKEDICIVCPSQCSSCSIAELCDSCKASTKRINVPYCNQCPDQYYLEEGLEDCQACQTGCNKCESADYCFQCMIGYYRNLYYQCVNQCQDGYFNDISNLNDYKCTICDSNCLKCETTATKCTDCTLPLVLVNDLCFQCNQGQYLLGSICLSCIPGCQICTSNKCQICQDSFYYQASINECVGYCNPNQYTNTLTQSCELCDPSCVTCNGGTRYDCLTCIKGNVLNPLNIISGFCSSNCFIGFYKVSSYCAKCWKGCDSCVDQTQACLVCAQNYYRFTDTGLCHEICPNGYYNNKQGYVCSICNQACKTCYGRLNKNCLSCNDPLALYENQCLENCPDGYGNILSVCQSCTNNCKTCYGVDVNECTTCNRGFYYLKGQCYFKCPNFYIGVRPQYICKCIYENCVSCTTPQYYYQNRCYDVCPTGSYGFNSLCVTCYISCLTCFGEADDECLSCSKQQGLILFKTLCVTECFGNTYENTTLNECKDCDVTCNSCIGPLNNDCSSCPDQKVLSFEGTCIDSCSEGQYLVLSENKCYKCHPSCLTCFGNSHYNCLSCTFYLYLNQCVDSCPDGFTLSGNQRNCEPNVNIVISKCSYQCKTCKLTPRFCTDCSELRFFNPPNCDCNQGYYNTEVNNCKKCENKCFTCSGNAQTCLKCKGNRLLPKCHCPKYYYDDGSSVNCNQCSQNCATCDNNETCLTCLTNRINSPDCICPEGFYEANSLYCQECSSKCLTCTGSEYLCDTCSEIRVDPPVCSCPYGYFNNSDDLCQKCDPTCEDCDQTGCLTCFGNRENSEGRCLCNFKGVSRIIIGSLYCTDCALGVPLFSLNEDFTGFNIDFGRPVQLLDQLKKILLCDLIFDKQTLIKLGKNPSCNYDLLVIFGENPNLHVGETLQMNPVFSLQGCSSPFEKILLMPLQIPMKINLLTHKPQIIFNPINKPNICAFISFHFEKKIYNGGQQLEILSWEMILPTTLDQNINNILSVNTLNNSESIIFPPKTLQPNQLYKFQVSVRSFANLENTIILSFETIVKSTTLFSPKNKDNQFNRFQPINIPSKIDYFNCLEITPPPQTLFYWIIFNDQQLINGTIENGLLDGYSLDIPLYFEPYYFNLTNPKTLQYITILKRADSIETTNSTFDIYIMASIPQIQIAGGNRMIGYTDDLYLNATINDRDLSPDEAVNILYHCFWSCSNIVNETACTDSNLQTIQFNNNCDQIIKSRTFAPYQAFNFQVSIVKEKSVYTTKVAIQIIEINLPILVVIGVDQTEIHNYYDEFIYSMQYSGINPDLLMYAGAVIYDQIVHASFEFYYLDFKFKLENYFSNLTIPLGYIISLRLSIYDPRFIMPSINTQTLRMNIPPQQCRTLIQTQDPVVEFLDQFIISIENCNDDNQPLLFDVWLFPNETIYKYNVLTSVFYNHIILVQDSLLNSFSLTIPYLNQVEFLLVFIIKDSQYGRTNLTEKVKIKQYISIQEENFQDYLIQHQDFDEKLLAYNLLTERLIRTDIFQDYKQTIFQQMIMIDENQTLLSNQTESLYHSISNLLNQNSSLLEIYKTALIYQLHFRTQIAYQKLISYHKIQINNKLTSAQNIDKNSYIKQYYTFTNILSSYINYQVANNISSTDIQSQLQLMQLQLQEISVANEPLYKVLAFSVNLNFGFVTEKKASSLSGSSLQESNKLSTNFYKYSMTRYIDNPYYTNEKFPKNSSGYQAIDPKIQLNSTSKNSNVSINFQFPTTKQLENNVSLKCISQVDSGEWNASICETVNQTGQVICNCQSINPTSIMESLNDILDKAEETFSLDTLLAFGSFPFYKTIVFYFYILITCVYLVAVYWGVKADNIMFTQIHSEQAVAEQKLTEEDQKVKENEERQEFDSMKNQTKDSNIVKLSTLISPDTLRIGDLHSPVFAQTSNKNGQMLLESQTPSIYNNDKEPKQSGDNESRAYIDQIKHNALHQIDIYHIREHKLNIEQENVCQKPIGLKQKLFDHSITQLKALMEYLKFFHQLISIIYKSDEKKPRGLRASIVYTSVIGSLAVLFVFNQPNNLNLTVSLALLTLPINKIYQILLEKLLSHNKKSVRAIGASFMIFSAAIISYVMLAGLVMLDSVETANQWGFIFLSQFFGDNLCYSPISLTVQYFIHMEFIKSPIFKKLLDIILDEKAKEFLYGLVHLNEEQ